MAKATVLILFMVIQLLFSSSGGTVRLASGQKTWCVAKPSSSEETLQANKGYACSYVDCSVIGSNGLCFEPESSISHASIAMNLYYQTKGRTQINCDFKKSALIVTTDPSYDNCKYA